MTTRRAFTLIELLVTILIMGLLTAVAVVNYISSQQVAEDNASKAAISSIATAIETYYNDNHAFPGNYQGTTDASSCQITDSGATPYVAYSYSPNKNCTSTAPFTSADITPAWIPGLTNYMSKVPIDTNYQDSNGTSYNSLIQSGDTGSDLEQWTNANERTYTYRQIYTGTSYGYILYAKLLGSTGTITSLPATSGIPTVLSNNAPALSSGESMYVIQR